MRGGRWSGGVGHGGGVGCPSSVSFAECACKEGRKLKVEAEAQEQEETPSVPAVAETPRTPQVSVEGEGSDPRSPLSEPPGPLPPPCASRRVLEDDPAATLPVQPAVPTEFREHPHLRPPRPPTALPRRQGFVVGLCRTACGGDFHNLSFLKGSRLRSSVRMSRDSWAFAKDERPRERFRSVSGCVVLRRGSSVPRWVLRWVLCPLRDPHERDYGRFPWLWL